MSEEGIESQVPHLEVPCLKLALKVISSVLE